MPMFHVMTHGRFNGALILRLVRDGECSTIEQLNARLLPELNDQTRADSAQRQRLIRDKQILSYMITDLAAAGFLKIDNSEVRATALIEKVQTFLDLDLTELSKSGRNRVMLNPIFGPPYRSDGQADVFVLMPFTKDLLPVYEDHIKKVAGKLKLTTSRADDFFAANSIMDDIWEAICGSRIVIADCTTRNPNVFYEIGLAHTVGRTTILISQTIDDVPFDLRHIRCIIYEYTPRGMKAFNEALEATLTTEVAQLRN